MRFRKGAKLDPGQVTDVRGRRVGGAGGLAVGGGGIGVVVLIIYVLVSAFSGGGGLGGQLGPLENQRVGEDSTPSQVSEECKTGEDANQREDCRIVAVVNSVQKFWGEVFTRSGEQYQNVDTVFFTDQVNTGCGNATSQVGPFYCPADKDLYLDTSFFNELHARFGAPGDFAQAYVIAHEVGHHVQNLLGTMRQFDAQRQRSDERTANMLSVRLELQADCYAGVWGFYSQKRGIIDAKDIESGLRAAAAVGDDQIQKRTQGYVVPDSFTHGSAEERTRWFRTGLQSGDPRDCNTFNAR